MLIGISGKMHSGKDTLAKILQKLLLPEEYETKYFAYKLKQITSILTNTSIEDNLSVEGKNKILPEWGMSLGAIQQKIGTDAIRDKVHRDAWVLALFNEYTVNSNWIITDVRFPNEVERIKSFDGYLIRINGDPLGLRIKSNRKINHSSEISLDDYAKWDFVLDNNFGISNLEEKAAKILKFIESEKLQTTVYL